MDKQGIYLGPRLRRLRRDLGLTQSDMAADLCVSPSYVALMEGNQRPVTAEVLLKLARAYKIEFADFASETVPDLITRLHSLARDPILANIEMQRTELADVVHSFPGFAEAMIRLYTAYKESQFALADQRESTMQGPAGSVDPVAEVRNFLAARRNCFPHLDAACEKLAARVDESGGLAKYIASTHGLRTRRVPPEVMVGSVRRLDWHRREILLSDTIDAASENFHLAQQLAYLEFTKDIDALVAEGNLAGESTVRLAQRALAGYCGAAIIMPYAPFAKAAEARGYDIEALSRQFSTSFEQTAHRLTTLQKPGQEKIPFFFIRVDEAGNVSKRLDNTNFPFARHGGGCPLWSVHQVFSTPRKVVTQALELPDGNRFLSIARTVSSGGGGYREDRVERAVALVCDAQYTERLVYFRKRATPEVPTPIGVTCKLCHRESCRARSEPPIGLQILPDSIRRTDAPFGFSDV